MLVHLERNKHKTIEHKVDSQIISHMQYILLKKLFIIIYNYYFNYHKTLKKEKKEKAIGFIDMKIIMSIFFILH